MQTGRKKPFSRLEADFSSEESKRFSDVAVVQWLDTQNIPSGRPRPKNGHGKELVRQDFFFFCFFGNLSV